MSGAERRAAAREPLEIEAFLVAGAERRTSQVRDFCVGGMFLMVDGQDDDYLLLAGKQIVRDDTLSVALTLEVESQVCEFAMKVRVAGLFAGGMGVEFTDPEPRAIHAWSRPRRRGRG